MKRRILSLLLVLCMAVTMVPSQVFATEQERAIPFDDVRINDWYYDAVRYVYENSIFFGTSETRFSPGGTMTRAMFVTVLGRMAGVDPSAYAGETSFTDVDPSSYYAPYVAWAAKHGITSGTGGGKFSPDALINREQMAALFIRYFDIFGVDYETGANITSTPADLDAVSDYAKDAVMKLWRTGLLAGNGVTFDPKGNATRAQAAALCMRTDDAVEVWYKEPGVPSNRVRKYLKTNSGSSESGTAVTYYTFKFNSNGGSSVSDRSIREGSRLDNLPTPYKENAIFIGWCYDSALTQLVADSDTAQRSTILYAKYEELPPLNEEFYTPVASALDANKNLSVVVKAPTDMTLDEFKDAVTLQNLSSNEKKEWFKITGGNGTFTISGLNYLGAQGAQQPGFVEGSAYKIILEDKNLFFEGQDRSTREYVITINREEVVNVSLNNNMRQIPISDISNLIVNGASASTISIPVLTVGMDGAPAENGVTKGSFTYSKGTLAVGDTVMIYDGINPPSMDAVSNDENTAFVEITGVNGNSYTYKTASAEKVLFTPDILPVSVDADTDGNPNNNAMTVPISVMTYTDDHFALAGLDSQTTIDVGDFISFYTGTLTENGTLATGGALQGYARITSVEKSGENYIITYEPVTLTDVQKSMAAYKKENIDSNDLLEGVDRQAIERNVEMQARESGFAEEAGMYLAALALETDSFTELRDDYQLTAIEMTMNGQPITQETIQSMGASKAKVELSKLQAKLSTDLVHFKDLKGLRLTLSVGVKVIIECNDDVTIEIEVVGLFEQEVRIDIGVDGDAVWNWWGIFPYIAEYEVTAFVELYEYTGIGIEATIATIEPDEDGFDTKNESIENIGKQIKELMDQKDKYFGDGQKTVGASLEEKYSEMLENETDWVTLFEKELIDRDFNVLLIIAINIEVKFVVSANLNISLGMDFWYENAKRYVYTIQVFANKVKSDVIDLVEEHWEFEFYVMGTMGLRAGIRAGISVGLLSTKLASVGFSAEAGAYVRVWGYFYYQLKYTASQGRTSSFSGALYLEFGIYLEVNFEAQALNGKFSYEYALYEKEWPLLWAGDRDNVRDFAYKQQETPEIKLKSYITSARLPDELFNMAYLDLKEGMEKDENGNRVLSIANYDAPLGSDRTGLSLDKLDDEKNFTVEMTNTAFSYDPETNTVSVNPNGAIKHEGEMIITWKNRPMEFSSVPISRTITLYWDNLKDGYVIAPFTNGGSYVPMIIKKYEEAVVAPQNPTKMGYVFAGWYSDENLTRPYTFPQTMPNVDTSIYAKWTPATDTPYTVEHYQQKLGSSEYALVDRESFKGTTDSIVTPLTKSYMGFKTPAQESLVIKADGSSVLRYYYDRQTYTVTFNPGEVGGDPVVIRLKYGSTISAPLFGAKGYEFKGWDKIVSTYMEDQDLTYTALWEKEQTTEYRVEYYVQQPDGRYVLQNVEYRTGATGENIDADGLRRDAAYVIEGVTSFRNVTVGGEPKDSVAITGDGKTVIKVNYHRAQYNVTFNPENGDADIVYTLYSGAAITAPTVSRMGYNFSGWSGTVPATIGKENLTFTAQWSPASGIAYRVKHVREALDGTYPENGALVEYVDKTGTTGDDTAAQAVTYEGFTAQSFSQKKIAPNGSTIVEIRYSRNSYPVHWVVDGVTDTVLVKYGAVITKPEDPTKQGYELDRWEGFAEATIMGTTEKTFTAVWKPASNTPYKVKHIRADLDGSYPTEGPLVELETRHGTTGTQTAAVAKGYEGFTAQPISQAEILPDGSTEVIITYYRNAYTVSWMADNTTFATTVVTYDAIILVPDGTPEKTGYSFVLWKNIPDTMPAKDISILAMFNPNTYSVSFDMNKGDGPVPESINVTFDSAYGTLPVPTYIGYRFERWVDENGITVTSATIVNTPRDHTLKAIWVAEDAMPYQVKHLIQNVSGDGYTVFEIETRYGETDTQTDATAKIYEGFTAKQFSQGNINGDGSTVIEIYYDRNVNTITWYINDETQTQTYRYGQTIIPPAANARPGYNFAGWDVTPPATMPNSSLAFTARWTEASYTVSFNGNGGSHQEAVTVTYNGTYPALAGSSRIGYTFSGWFTEAQGGAQIKEGDQVKITGNITLYAHWVPNTYVVSFDLNGLTGEAPESMTVTYDEMFGDLPSVSASKSGYRFGGWYTSPSGGDKVTSSTIVKITAPTTLFARWIPNTYTIKFNPNGGSGLMADQIHTYDQSLALTKGMFVKEGYAFAGWNTQAEGSGKAYSDMEAVMNLTETHGAEITLYAQWSIKSYTVTFNSLGGTPDEAVTQLYNTYIDKPNDPVKYGYSFMGWMNGENEVTFPVRLVENLNLTARWKAVEYAITYMGMDGIDNSNPTSYTIESDALVLANPGVKTGYTFMGWYTDESLSEESKVSGIAIAAGSTGARTFYAGWKANTYGVNFDDGTESNNSGGNMSAQIFTYDVEQPLKSNEFTNPGYSFAGWGLAPNSTVLYTNGEIVKNLVPSGSITLYAQWELINYTISYTLGSGATGANNPTTYNIETDDITLNNPSGIKAGYRFLGWYDGSTKVNSIPKGSTGNVVLTAKWEHGGTFTLAKTGETTNGSAKDITFTVTRTIPNDAVATSDTQYVYYRTVNGTAIGGTAAPIHFSHVGGEDVFLTFNQNDTSKTFVVRSERTFTGNDDIVNSFTNGVNRYYDVELYKVKSASGICTGTLGTTSKVRRTLTQSSTYVLTNTLLTQEYSKTLTTSEIKVTDDGFDKNTTYSVSATPYSSTIQDALERYTRAVGNYYGVRMTMEVKEENDGYQHSQLLSASGNYAQWKFEIDKGDPYTKQYVNLDLPITGKQGIIEFTESAYPGKTTITSGSNTYVKSDPGEQYVLKFNASGNGSDNWFYKNLVFRVKIFDTAKPTVKRIAPMAFGKYKAGDTVTLAVEFNEVINSASGVTMSKISYIPVNTWSYVDGAGTNVLVFKGTLTGHFEVDTAMIMTLTGTKPTVGGTIRDLVN